MDISKQKRKSVFNVRFPSLAVGMCRKLKKLLRRRKSDLDSKQEEELNKTLQRHEKDHILGPFVGLSPEYMEMSELTQSSTQIQKHMQHAHCCSALYMLLKGI